MLTLDTVRTALLSDQPWSRLDELVRAELASGQTTRQIYKSLMGMADEIDAIPHLTEDGSDALGDVLDALTGYCRADCQYKDPPNPELPNEEEIAKLPRWVQVSFVARCARRVFQLLPSVWPDISDEDLEKVEKSVTHAERIAGGEQPDKAIKTSFQLGAVDGAHHVGSRAKSEVAATIGLATASAVYAAYADYADMRTGHTFEGSTHAQSVAFQLGSLISITPHIRRDFDHLSRLAEWQEWTDDTPVPPEVFGPLWPEGPPKGWPPITDVPQRIELAIKAFARDRATEQMIEDDIVNLFNALNRYHIARSGVRLTLEQFQSLLPAFVPAEV